MSKIIFLCQYLAAKKMVDENFSHLNELGKKDMISNILNELIDNMEKILLG